MKLRYVLPAMLAGAVLPAAANAAITINISQVGSNVVASGAGTFDTTGFPVGTTNNYTIIVNGARGGIFVGTQKETVRYSFASGPSGFGTSNSFLTASSSTGDTFGVYGVDSAIHLPTAYVSGTSLAGTSTFSNQTLASLGLTQGTYVYSFGSDRVTIVVGAAAAAVPEPASWALMIAGFALAGAAMRARRRTSGATTLA